MARREFVESNGYPCTPIDINDKLWLYVEPKGLSVVTTPEGLLGYISWAKVLRAVEDHKYAKYRKKKS